MTAMYNGRLRAFIKRMRIALFCFALLTIGAGSAAARIGETPIQFADRYGRPRDNAVDKIADKNTPLLEGAIHHTYEYQSWKIRAAFLQLDGPCVRMEFSKIPKAGLNPAVRDYELDGITKANTPTGTTWKPIAYNNPDLPGNGFQKLAQAYFAGAIGEKMWQRSDGAILWLRSNLIVRVELSVARAYEAKLKVEKEQKARTSVPQF